MSSTTVLTVQQFILDQLAEVMTFDVQLSLAFPGDLLLAPASIYFGKTTVTPTMPTMRASIKRCEEEAVMDLAIWVSLAGQDAEASLVRAVELFGVLDTLIRTDPLLSACEMEPNQNVLALEITSWDLSGGPTETGHAARIDVTLTLHARVL
jgi:hypothetical protein